MTTLSQATRRVTAAQDRVNELQRWGRQGQALVVTALLIGAVTVLLAVLFAPQWAYLGIVAVVAAAFGTQIWIYANASSEFIKSATPGEGRYVTRMMLARTALANALDEYDEAIGREIK